MPTNKTLLAFLLTLFIFAGGFWAGQWLEKSQASICPDSPVDLSLFWQAWNLLKEKFVNQEQLKTEVMIHGAIAGMTKSLEDPYTVFLNPQDTKKFLEDVSGQFEGVGMEIGIRKGQLQVIAPLEGTPAKKAGLRAGDKIIKIGDTLTIDMTIDEAVNLIRGPKGTQVLLTISRKEWAETKEFKITRDVIDIPSLKWELVDNNIAHIKLYHFTEKARTDFARAVFEILKSPAQRLVLDLRNNPGGYLEVAQDIAGWFLERGQVVAIEDFGQGQKEYKAQGRPELLPFPTVVLLNQGSASGAEILAGALRDNREAPLIGEKSFGKGSVQQLEKLRDGSSLKVTIANWLTPNGQLITDKGLTPDFEVELTSDDYEQEKDPQLDKALEILKSL